MTRIEYMPDAALQQDIKHIWLVEKPPRVYERDDIMPDAHTELIVNCGAPLMLVRENGSEVELPDVFLNHLQTKPMRFRANGTHQVIAVCLYPWAQPKNVTLLAGTSLIRLDDQWNCFAQSLFLLFWQVTLGVSLSKRTEHRRVQRRWHFAAMLGIVGLASGHILLNSVLIRVLFH